MAGIARSSAASVRCYAAAVAAIAIVNLALGTLDPMQPLPRDIPARAAVADASALLMLLAALGLWWRRTATASAAYLAAYFAVVVTVLMNLLTDFARPPEYGTFFGAVEGVALAAPAVVVVATAMRDPIIARRALRAAQTAFGLCAIYFGGAHFAYPGATIPLVPQWLPPSPTFWAYATGVLHIAGGVAIVTGFRSRLAAILLAAMYAAFTPLVHLPLLLGDPSKPFYWTENALNLALAAAAWVVADSLGAAPQPGDAPR